MTILVPFLLLGILPNSVIQACTLAAERFDHFFMHPAPLLAYPPGLGNPKVDTSLKKKRGQEAKTHVGVYAPKKKKTILTSCWFFITVVSPSSDVSLSSSHPNH